MTVENNAAPADQTEQAGEETAGEETQADQGSPADQQAAEQIRKFKLKVNGAERELDEKSLLAFAQKGLAADEKFQSAAQQRKQVERLIKLAKEDPDVLLRELTGEDPEEIYKRRLSAKLEELSLDPKEKELRDYKKKIEEYEKREAKRKEEAEQAQHSRAVEYWTQKYDKELPSAIKAAGLPMTEDVIKHTAEVMIANLEEGFDMPIEAVMEVVKDRHLASIKNFLTAAEKEKLVDLLGEDVVDGIIAARAKKANKSQKSTQKPTIQASESGGQSRQKKSYKEALAELDEQISKWSGG